MPHEGTDIRGAARSGHSLRRHRRRGSGGNGRLRPRRQVVRDRPESGQCQETAQGPGPVRGRPAASRSQVRQGRTTGTPRSPPTRRPSAPGPSPTRWTCRPRGRIPKKVYEAFTRGAVADGGHSDAPGADAPRATDLRCTPADQLESGARRGARPKGPDLTESCGCSSVVEHPPSRGKAQCAIPVTRSASPYRPLLWIR